MNRIRDLREDNDLRQQDLAKEVGIDQRTISNYETGKTNPDSEALIKLADYFNVSIDYLVCRNNNSLNINKQIIAKIEAIELELIKIKKQLS